MIELSVENLYGGGVVERIHEEIKRAIQNIVDPNTPAKKVRKVKMEIAIRPNEQRNMAEIVVSTSSTLCPPEPIETSIYIGADPRTGEVGASEMQGGETFGQAILPEVETAMSSKITKFPGKRLAGGTN